MNKSRFITYSNFYLKTCIFVEISFTRPMGKPHFINFKSQKKWDYLQIAHVQQH